MLVDLILIVVGIILVIHLCAKIWPKSGWARAAFLFRMFGNKAADAMTDANLTAAYKEAVAEDAAVIATNTKKIGQIKGQLAGLRRDRDLAAEELKDLEFGIDRAFDKGDVDEQNYLDARHTAKQQQIAQADATIESLETQLKDLTAEPIKAQRRNAEDQAAAGTVEAEVKLAEATESISDMAASIDQGGSGRAAEIRKRAQGAADRAQGIASIRKEVAAAAGPTNEELHQQRMAASGSSYLARKRAEAAAAKAGEAPAATPPAQ